ncbi:MULTISPECIES: S1 family peptidase [Cysteiniphilum]|uniref:Serine protease n=1 Tax=Cysteiniphilum litorale TaxID=2056700 RepID=A0A8J2Z5U9_9GAMM|nr:MULTISPECIES: serine protease [Cysteiniphilum]GGG03627.1 serine protease [Cysteiniphilum litorale]
MRKLLMCASIVLTSTTVFGNNISQPTFHSRITWGSDAAKGEFPFYVGVLINTEDGLKQFCGGTLIDKQWVLTAAHCINTDVNKVLLQIGREEFGSQTDENTYRITQAIRHPSYLHDDSGAPDYYNHTDDIGLYKLEKPVPPEIYADIINLYNSDKPADGEQFTVIGMGRTETGLWKKRLQKTRVQIDDSSQGCHAWGFDENKDICARSISQAIDHISNISNGDSGGPILMFDKNGQPYQVGITSRSGHTDSEDMAFPAYHYPYAAFTYIPSYINWINEQKARFQ